ncbi:MAG: hypothetical protein Q7J86_08170 [Bacteroidota bacterium]|nr:hypothetical protein [Bacteroidota bacterium]
MIDINILPQKAQNELIDFYYFLLERYVPEKQKRNTSDDLATEKVNRFFDQYNLDLTNYNFNRSEL